MIKKGIIDYLADKLNIEAKEIIEKDLGPSRVCEGLRWNKGPRHCDGHDPDGG